MFEGLDPTGRTSRSRCCQVEASLGHDADSLSLGAGIQRNGFPTSYLPAILAA